MKTMNPFGVRKKILLNILLLVAGFGLSFSSSPAMANKAGDVQKINSAGQMYPGAGGCDSSVSRGCDLTNHIWNANKASSYNVNKYSRGGAKAENLYWDYTIPAAYPDNGGTQGRYQVGGEYTCQSNMSWTWSLTGGQNLCWGAHTLYSAKNCKGARNVASYSARTSGGVISPAVVCSSGVCVVDYQPALAPKHFITADTGDNMMAMLPTGEAVKGFLVNNYCGSVPYWIERRGPEGGKYLMIPTKCDDYQTFINAKPAAARSENACHPAILSVCPAPPSRPAMPPHPGCGGYAHGASWCSGGYKSVSSCSTGSDGKQTCTTSQVCQKWSSCDCGTVR